MPWVRFDDQFPIHKKVDNLSDPAFRLHVSAIFWCARNLTDGYVPEEDLDAAAPRKMKRPDRFVTELVGRGLWLPDNRGWWVNDYLKYQPSKDKVEKDRRDAAERQRKWREQQQPDSNAVTNAVTNTVTNAVSHTAPSRPVPTRPVPGAPTGLRPYGALPGNRVL